MPTLAPSMLGMIMSALDDPAPAEFIVHAAADLIMPQTIAPESTFSIDDAAYDPQLAQAYAWEYPYAGAERAPLKLTASGLLRGIEGPDVIEPLAPRPLFMQEQQVTAAERGTAHHRALQLIKIENLRGKTGKELLKEIESQLDTFANRLLMTTEERDAVSAGTLAKFYESSLGRRVLAAISPMRERNFNVLLPAETALTPNEARGATGDLLVQGTIDLCFMENGGWVLVDYKTSRATDLEDIARRYAPQLNLYALALSRITGIEVLEKYICLVGQGDIIAM
jgi:ATP-dependent helicase/nuclease subunit A